jgi:hypothetical protein
MSQIRLPVSIGEALDKLSILEIKLHYIKDERRNDVEKEYTLLKQELENYFTDDSVFHYRVLKEINQDIWTMQDKFRESENDEEKTSLCTKIIEENDRRFQVKKKLNTLFTSSIQEQKAYAKRSAFFYGHIGLGDLIGCIGIYRYLSTIYDKVTVVVPERYSVVFSTMLSDDKSIHFLSIDNDYALTDKFITKEKFSEIVGDADVYLAGDKTGNKDVIVTHLPYSFFYDCCIPFHYFWSYFHIKTFNESKELASMVINTEQGFQNQSARSADISENTGMMNTVENSITEYIVIHNTSSTGKVFTTEFVEKTLNINREDVLFININENTYPEGHKWYSLAQIFVNKPLVLYKDTLENASYVCVTDSSLFCLAIHMNLKNAKDCCYIPRSKYSDYDYYFDDSVLDDNKKYKPFQEKVFRKVLRELHQ